MNYLLIGMVTFLVVMIMAGMFNGFVKSVVGLVVYALSTTFSIIITIMFSMLFKQGRGADAIVFAVSFVIIYLGLIVVGYSLNIITKLPVISTLNRLLGAIMGGLLGLLCSMIFFAVIYFLETHGTSTIFLPMINSDEFLKNLYDNNIIQVLLERFL